MRERPLKFNDELLAKVLSGEKTQTRRPVKGYDVFEFVEEGFATGMWRVHGPSLIDVPELDDDDNVISVTPAGTHEKTMVRGKFIDHYCPYTLGNYLINACDKDGVPVCKIAVNVRVERLQDISEADCAAEGLGSPFLRDYKKPKFAELWQSIYGEEGWQANPWVWVIEFKRIGGAS